MLYYYTICHITHIQPTCIHAIYTLHAYTTCVYNNLIHTHTYVHTRLYECVCIHTHVHTLDSGAQSLSDLDQVPSPHQASVFSSVKVVNTGEILITDLKGPSAKMLPCPTLTAPTTAGPPEGQASQPPCLQSEPSWAPNREGGPGKFSKGQACQPGQPVHSIDPSLGKTSSPPAQLSLEGLQKNREKRKTEREGEGEDENAEWASFPCLWRAMDFTAGRRCWAAPVRRGWRPGLSPAPPRTGHEAPKGQFWVSVWSSVDRRLLCPQLTSYCLPHKDPNARTLRGTEGKQPHCGLTAPGRGPQGAHQPHLLADLQRQELRSSPTWGQ